MRSNESRQLRSFGRSALAPLALAIFLQAPAFSLRVVQAQEKPKDNRDDFTRVYEFTYNDVFEAAYQYYFRDGANIKTADKDKGLLIVVGNAINGPEDRCTNDIRIEAISPAPETRVTFHRQCGKPIHHKWEPAFRTAGRFFIGLQKILATYK
jgi:hypothetical protein